MKRNKGFTLIELLAVIVILAIIALIATPMILGVIETAKKGASEASSLGYIDAVEKQVAINELDSTKEPLNDGVYEIGNLKDAKYGITVKGETPKSGWIQIEDGRVSNYSVVIDNYVVTKGVELEKGNSAKNKPVCIKATKLHTEECTQTSTIRSCSNDGYVNGNKGTTITYGTIVDGELKSGDALDCDVDGNGIYNERFYYVTDLEQDDNYAVLIYYNNTTSGIADNTNAGLIAYDASNENWHGPKSGVKNLPTTEQWGNVSLFSTTRTIINELDGNTTNNGSNTIETFNYEGYAARLLTYQEVISVCGGTSNFGDSCSYLMENTRYSSSSIGNYGYWLETPYGSGISSAWCLNGDNRHIHSSSVNYSKNMAVRPVIEVLKSNISY